MSGRGITPEIAEYYRLGVVAEPLDGYAHLQGWLSIPYITLGGIVQVKYRCLQDHDCGDHGHQKYTGEAGTGVALFNVNAFHRVSKAIVLTEGEFDAMAVEVYLGIPSVAYPGVSTWGKNPHWARCFTGYDTVWIIADGDEPGMNAAKRLVDGPQGEEKRRYENWRCLDNGVIVPMPDGLDANSFILERGAEALKAKLQ